MYVLEIVLYLGISHQSSLTGAAILGRSFILCHIAIVVAYVVESDIKHSHPYIPSRELN